MSRPVWPARLYALDVSRGFAALSVVLWHWQHFAYEGTRAPLHFERESQPLYGLLRIFYEKGNLGVDYFFLLSGFIFFWVYQRPISDKAVAWRDFWLHRFSRLYPLHVATLLIVALLQFLYHAKNETFFVYPFNDPYHFILNLGFASHWGLQRGWSFNAPVWSVSIEILLYAFFFLMAYSQRGSAVTCLSISFASYGAGLKMPFGVFGGLSMFFWGGFIFHLTVGIATRRQAYKNFIHVIAVVSWILVLLHFYVFGFDSFGRSLGKTGVLLLELFPLYVLFPASVSSLALAEITGKVQLKPIAWIGDITYSSYMLHFPLQLGVGLAIGTGIIASGFYTETIYLLFFFALLIPLSYLSFICFERPMQNIIRRKCGRSSRLVE